MKNYKFILIIFFLIGLGLFLGVTSINLPAPHKINTKVIDINDETIK